MRKQLFKKGRRSLAFLLSAALVFNAAPSFGQGKVSASPVTETEAAETTEVQERDEYTLLPDELRQVEYFNPDGSME